MLLCMLIFYLLYFSVDSIIIVSMIITRVKMLDFRASEIYRDIRVKDIKNNNK